MGRTSVGAGSKFLGNREPLLGAAGDMLLHGQPSLADAPRKGVPQTIDDRSGTMRSDLGSYHRRRNLGRDRCALNQHTKTAISGRAGMARLVYDSPQVFGIQRRVDVPEDKPPKPGVGAS